MDKNIYEKTRWENIFRHKKNKNYIVRIANPDTTISRDETGKKIFDSEIARRIRDNPTIRNSKKIEIEHKETFDVLWEKYIDDCKYVKKQAYSTIKRKEKCYNRYLKDKIKRNLHKTDKNYWASYIHNLECSIKQKNNALKNLKAFFNWCVDNNYLITNQVVGIKKYAIPKTEMKFWTVDEITKFSSTINDYTNSDDIKIKIKAKRIRLFFVIGFTLGDRVGETRALTFDCLNKNYKTIHINHSINYDTNSSNFLSTTKNYQSQREVDVTDKLIKEIEDYKSFLKNELHYDVKDDSLIFFNYKTNRPISDTTLRKDFYYFCDLIGVKKIRMYDLRHTFVATMMLEGKQLYQISEKIGHSSYQTTVDKYGHLSTELKKEIAKVTDKYI